MRPPGRRLLSNSATSWPASVSARPQANPAMPAPTIAIRIDQVPGTAGSAAAVAAALDAPGPIGRPLIVADPDPLTLPEMIAALRAGLGRGPGLLPCPTPLIGLACRATGRHEVFDRLSGSLVARPDGLTALGWRPAQGTRDGLAALAQAGG